MDYVNSRIYKVVNDVNDDVYVGSTTQKLCQRMATHRSNAKKYPNRKIYKMINTIGIEHFKIILIEKYPCKSREELNTREEHYRKLLKPTLNNNRCHIDDYTNYFNEKIMCNHCKGKYTRCNKSTHERTIKHHKALEAIAPQ
jgi:group I intron endonuclease